MTAPLTAEQLVARRAAVARLSAAGVRPCEIGRRLGVTRSAVDRDRRHLGLVPYVPRAGYVDVVAVELAVRGGNGNDRVELTRDERHLAVRALVDRGHTDGVIAQMLSVSIRTVERDRVELNLPAPYLERRRAA